MRLIFSLNIRVQTMDFRRLRGFLFDGEDPPEKVGCRKESYFLEFMHVDVARHYVGVVFHVLKGSHNHRDCCCFEPPHSLNLDFQVFVFGKLDWGVGVEGYSRVNEKAGFILPVLLHNVRPISFYGPVSVDRHVPQNRDAVILGDSLGFVLIPSFLPLHVCSCLVVTVDKISFSHFRATRDHVVISLVETATQSTSWVHVRLLEDVAYFVRLWSWAAMIKPQQLSLGFCGSLLPRPRLDYPQGGRNGRRKAYNRIQRVSLLESHGDSHLVAACIYTWAWRWTSVTCIE